MGLCGRGGGRPGSHRGRPLFIGREGTALNHTEEFASRYTCEAPGGLPSALGARLDFLSCLSGGEKRSVYLVRDGQSGRKAVLKISEPGSANSASREHALLAKLEHPAIPRAILLERDDKGREYLLRDFAEGETLDRLIERDGVFSDRQVLEITRKLCDVLSYLHGQTPPIIYRDVKPQNIVMTQNGRITLIDFGISREDASDKDFDTMYVGSVAFAAPEQFGFTKTDSRSDVFSLGKLMLYLATGNAQLPGFRERVESRKLAGLIAKCTALSPDKRYASVDRLSRAIGRILYPPSRREILVGGLAALLALSIGLFSLWLIYGPEAEAPTAEPLSAGGAEYVDEVKIPVLIETLMEGEAFADCAVAVDNHHWYAPAESGKAELLVYAYDEYRIRAAHKNQTASAQTPVTRDTGAVSLAFDFADVPTAPECLSLELEFGAAQEIPLDIALADEVSLSGQPEGLSVIRKEDGQFCLAISEALADPGHYTVFLEAVNDFGKADMVLSLYFREDAPVTTIRTAEEFFDIRNDLAGHYALAADIDLGGYESWTPIGNDGYFFTGTLDGNGHTITGLAFNRYNAEDEPRMGLFALVEKGVIRNLIIREADMTITRSSVGGVAVLVGENRSGLIENCAVIGGELRADIGMESSAAGIAGVNAGVIQNCFNSAEITIFTAGSKSFTDSFAGGICGVNNGYLADCGNTGAVTGIALAGGVAAYNDAGILTRCYNVGGVTAPVYPPSFFPGGIVHLLGRGKIVSYCAFAEGTAQLGAGVYNGGTLLGIAPLPGERLRDIDALRAVFHADAEQDGFVYASLDSRYPVPAGIFRERAEAPALRGSGSTVALPALENVRYFYTTDGSDPHVGDVEGVESAEIALESGEVLRVFAAKQGFIDSGVVALEAARG